MKHFTKLLIIKLLLLASSFVQAQTDETLLLRMPAISAQQIAFAYAGDIWVADKSGNNPQRLTVSAGTENHPYFSPDGKWLAFSGNYDGNMDVYMVAVSGGMPKRLTYHPSMDIVRGWSNDGQSVLFSSNAESNSTRYLKIFKISPNGGLAEALPMPAASHLSLAPEGNSLAYVPNRDPFEIDGGTYRPFKHYRGGNTARIWLFNLKNNEVEEIPAAKANNTQPKWIGNKIYFLSDRNRTNNIFEFEVNSKTITQITNHTDYDVKALNSNGEEIIYEQAGKLHILSLSNKQTRPLKIKLNADLPSQRPHFENVTNMIRNIDVSPTGVRAVVEARGDIFTIPADKGDTRNLTNSSGAHERSPAWSPDGKWLAFFSDESGEYQLKLVNQTAKETQTIALEPSFYYAPQWSPDSKKLLFTDKRMNVFYVDLSNKKPILVDSDSFDTPQQAMEPSWSPDSQWITYQKQLDNHLHAIFVYELASAKKTQVTDGMSDAVSPSFSADGKYLFFAASTNYGLNIGWLDMTSYERPIRRNIYALVLNSQDKSPLAPQSDEETVSEAKTETPSTAPVKKPEEKPKETKAAAKVTIDFKNLDQRIVALPMPERDYSNLTTIEGKLFYLENVQNQVGSTLHRYDIKDRKSEVFIEGVFNFKMSGNGKKIIYNTQGNNYFMTDVASKPKGEGKLNLSNLRMYVDPLAEYQQMFNEVWRIERDFLYVPNMHGADWQAVKKKYAGLVAHVRSREDLNYLFSEMLGELVLGHSYVSGGDFPDTENVNIGMLGADYQIDNGFYKIKKIYGGLNWNPTFRAPLTEPGVNINEGDYILAVNGVALRGTMSIYSLFENLADKQVVLKVNSQPSEAGAREVTVVPINNEGNLRNMAWVEGNRKRVDELSGGKIAYVYMPNTGGGGYTFFNRYYFAQIGKQAVIIDERFNGGGSAADYVIDLLDRDLMNYWATREGKVSTTPNAAIFGPKAMITNEYAASGGDLMPFLFREKKLGKLVGKTTLGILVGIYNYPVLIDGGSVTAPRLGIFDKNGKWIVENEGIAPDIEVEMTPKEVIKGKDPQLDKAVEVLLEELKTKTVPRITTNPVGPKRAD
jgi:tricorn protease